MAHEYSEAAARSAHCWFGVDHVPGEPETTAWKRLARWRQAQWREERGHAIGAHPYGGGAGAKPVGSRLELDFATSSGAAFLTPGVLSAVRARLAKPEPGEMLHEGRLYCDLLSSMPLCFNLFGDLAGNAGAARRAVSLWWPQAPEGPVHVQFEHSPARGDGEFLGNKSAFDVAFEIDGGDAGAAIVGVETKYHEHAKAEAKPKKAALARYVEVTERSGAFDEGWRDHVLGTDLQQIWLDHLLVLAMLQHPTKRWTWGRFVLVYPEANPIFSTAASRYRKILRDPTTFEARTLESLLAVPGALPASFVEAFRHRYL